MDDAAIDTVRRFTRTVTQRVGALDDRALSRDRPLGASRVLWEIGEGGRDVRDLRAGLGLDSGYLSRLLRSLAREGLVRVGPGTPDRRVRRARLTAEGRRERALLDGRSDAQAASLLEPLPPAQRRRLVAAMAEVERLLRAGMVDVAPADPADPGARACLAAYAAELDDRFPGGFDPAASLPADDDDLRSPRGLLVLASLAGRPLGCAALKLHGDEPAEVERMWVAGDARGLGIGRRLLTAVESAAAEAGARVLRLETNETLTEAIALYRSAGWTEVPRFNDEPYAHHWFEKRVEAPGAAH
jgi:DNA-binding MarR family transcriptional regulator/GNAT superfamily N-acetyltransferase